MTGRIKRTLEHEERERARKRREMSFRKEVRRGAAELLAKTGRVRLLLSQAARNSVSRGAPRDDGINKISARLLTRRPAGGRTRS